MAVRNLWLLGGGLAACLVLCGDGYPKQDPLPAPATALPQPLPPDSAPRAVAPPTLAPAPVETVDLLLDRLTELRRQKAELERQEQLLIKQLRDKFKALTERLEKLGIMPDAAAKAD
jgi:hypothetical protein